MIPTQDIFLPFATFFSVFTLLLVATRKPMGLWNCLLSSLCLILMVNPASSNAGIDNQFRIMNPWEMFSATPRNSEPFAIRSSGPLKVTNWNGDPLPGAYILLGSEPNEDRSNILEADALGQFEAPATWQQPITVTVFAKGHVLATFYNQVPMGQNFQVRPWDSGSRYEVTGETPGISTVNKDDKADFAIVFPAVSRAELFNFKLTSIISSDRDPVDVRGNRIFLPSNLTLPRQTEKYSIFSVELNKPKYRTRFVHKGDYKVFAAHGQFPFSSTIAAFRQGKDLVDMLNDLTFLKGTLAPVSATAASNPLDIPLQQGTTFSAGLSLESPTLLQGEVLLVASLLNDSALFYPTDVKLMESRTKRYLSLPQKVTNPMLLAMRKRKNQVYMGPGSDRMSASLLDFKDGIKADPLPLVGDILVKSGWREVIAPAPVVSQGVVPKGVYASLQQMHYVRNKSGDVVGEVAYPMWDVYAPSWQSVFVVPTWEGTEPKFIRRPNLSNPRWTVRFFGGSQPGVVDLGPDMGEDASHVAVTSGEF